MVNDHASLMMEEHFVNAPYIGRRQIFDREVRDLGPHKFYYVGFADLFGVITPETKNLKGHQLWCFDWCAGSDKKSRAALLNAAKGKFIECRHNIRLKQRAIEHGKKFFVRPEWQNSKKAANAKEGRLPLRKKKRTRRQLKI